MDSGGAPPLHPSFWDSALNRQLYGRPTMTYDEEQDIAPEGSAEGGGDWGPGPQPELVMPGARAVQQARMAAAQQAQATAAKAVFPEWKERFGAQNRMGIAQMQEEGKQGLREAQIKAEDALTLKRLAEKVRTDTLMPEEVKLLIVKAQTEGVNQGRYHQLALEAAARTRKTAAEEEQVTALTEPKVNTETSRGGWYDAGTMERLAAAGKAGAETKRTELLTPLEVDLEKRRAWRQRTGAGLDLARTATERTLLPAKQTAWGALTKQRETARTAKGAQGEVTAAAEPAYAEGGQDFLSELNALAATAPAKAPATAPAKAPATAPAEAPAGKVDASDYETIRVALTDAGGDSERLAEIVATLEARALETGAEADMNLAEWGRRLATTLGMVEE
jgi:hypothetical protein